MPFLEDASKASQRAQSVCPETGGILRDGGTHERPGMLRTPKQLLFHGPIPTGAQKAKTGGQSQLELQNF